MGDDILDRRALQDEIVGLLLAGWPDAIVKGFMAAKAKDLAERHDSAQWDEARRICDEVGQQVHQGDPIKKARVDHFNEMFIAELKKRHNK